MRFVWIFLWCFGSLYAKEKKTICLNMIVKDEAPVIERCLESVKPFIDRWVIVDTGSSDGTQEVIRRCLANVPGELHERPWVHFAHNRNEARELARGKGDYCLLIDADEVLVPSGKFRMPELREELYAISIFLHQPDGAVSSSPRAFLVSNGLGCKWVGALHEQLVPERTVEAFHMEEIAIETDTVSGHRSQDPKKYLKDALMLKKMLGEEPENSRHCFLMGASYELAGDNQRALEAFQRCAQMEQCPNAERYRSLFQIAILQKRLDKPPVQFLASFENALRFDPERAEPLFFMAQHYIEGLNWEKAYGLLKQAVAIPLPKHDAYVERSVYTWAALYNLSVCAEMLGKGEEVLQLQADLLACKELPPNLRKTLLRKVAR